MSVKSVKCHDVIGKCDYVFTQHGEILEGAIVCNNLAYQSTNNSCCKTCCYLCKSDRKCLTITGEGEGLSLLMKKRKIMKIIRDMKRCL
jgi:hypothetical protein